MQKQESFDCSAPAAPPPTVIHEHGVRFHAAPGTQAQDRLLRRPARQPQDALGVLRDGKRVLDLCCNSGGFAVYAKTHRRRGRGRRRRSRRGDPRRRRAQREAQQGARALRAGRHLRVAARRRGQQQRSVRRRRARSREDDARPRAGDSGAEEIPRHTNARLGAKSIGWAASLGAIAMPVAPPLASGAMPSACHWRGSSLDTWAGRGSDAQATRAAQQCERACALPPRPRPGPGERAPKRMRVAW